MNERLYPAIIIAAVGIAAYVLYCKGFAVSKSIAAILFVFRPGRNADKAALDSCTGWVRHVGRFRESRTYEFSLEAQLSKGNAEVVLLDKAERPLMRLNRQSPTGKIALDAASRYYLRWDFKGATGRCALHW